MRALCKFVAVVLAGALLAMPAAGLANCRMSGRGAAQACCATMMAMRQTAPAICAIPASESCCNLSSGQPAPPAQLQAPNSSRTVLSPVVTTAPLKVAMAPLRSESKDAVPLKLLPSTQAVLCTFLI
jgi:hypothetical protein